MHERKQ